MERYAAPQLSKHIISERNDLRHIRVQCPRHNGDPFPRWGTTFLTKRSLFLSCKCQNWSRRTFFKINKQQNIFMKSSEVQFQLCPNWKEAEAALFTLCILLCRSSSLQFSVWSMESMTVWVLLLEDSCDTRLSRHWLSSMTQETLALPEERPEYEGIRGRFWVARNCSLSEQLAKST